jgi:hypothetical protein
MAVTNQPGLLKDAEMLRDGRLRDSGLSRHHADRLFSPATKSLEDCPAGRVGKRPEECIVSVCHSTSITLWLWINL